MSRILLFLDVLSVMGVGYFGWKAIDSLAMWSTMSASEQLIELFVARQHLKYAGYFLGGMVLCIVWVMTRVFT